MSLKILYRGHLSDCNYTCAYCPFSMTRNTPAQQAEDARDLARFVAWVQTHASAARPIEILITPYGEALARKWYREAVRELSHTPQVRRIAVQTNLSCPVQWLADCNVQTTALWLTYHPEQIAAEKFLAKCHALSAMSIRYSVGVVGTRKHFPAIAAMRAALPESIYLWVNAYKDQADYYRPGEIAWLTGIDPRFPDNLPDYPSLGQPCQAGHEVISVDGTGNVYRCHFIKERLGNLFENELDTLLKPRLCSNAVCNCHIGYVHMNALKLHEVYGEGLLERIPAVVPEFRIGPLPQALQG